MQKSGHDLKNNIFRIPQEVSYVTETLEKGGFEAYLIGGCVRDILLHKKPKDWDVTTNATPEQIQALFPKTFYENTYGTVGVVHETFSDKSLEVIEVTPYRIEAGYSDNRRPDHVTFSSKLEDDVKRRDFTINALALTLKPLKDTLDGSKTADLHKGQLTDLHKGQVDLADKIIRTVGNPDERFAEDALRIIRAIRLSSELGFAIEGHTLMALHKHRGLLKNIAIERIRDEFNKIIASPEPMKGLQLAYETGVLHLIIPELEEGIKTEQNQAHAYDVWEHLLRTCQHAADKDYPFHVKLAALFHDIGKPRSRRWGEAQKQWTFYGHEVIGAKMTLKIMERMKYPKKLTEQVVKLVRWHMFFSDTEQITLSAVRRMIANVGEEMVWDLMNIRICDRVGTGRPKENPYRLRKYKAMVEMVLRDPVSVGMLKIDGKRLMEVAKLPAGPKIGYILHALLEDVLEDPKLNTPEYLEGRAIELAQLSEQELKNKGEQAKAKKEMEEERQLKEITDKYRVE